MLYGDKNNDFTKLSGALKELGIGEDTIDAGINYMNGDTADESLLDGIKPVKIVHSLTWGQRGVFRELNDKVYAKDNELYLRFLNFIFAAAGIESAAIVFDGVYSFDNSEKYRIKALKRRFPAEAEAIEFAMCAYYFHEVLHRTGYLNKKEPEICIKAIEMLGKYGSGDAYFPSKAALCIHALNRSPLPENDAAVMTSPTVRTACDTLINIYENAGKISAGQYNLIGVGMAEAAPFSEKAGRIFKSMAEKSLLNIVQLAHTMNIDRRRVPSVIESMPEIINVDYVHYIAEGHFTNITERLAKIAKYDPKMMRIALDSETQLKVACMLENVLAENDPDFDPKKYDLKSRAQRRAARALEAYCRDTPELIRNYLNGKGNYADIAPIFFGLKGLNNLSGGNNDFDYYGVFGADDFFKRIFTITMISNIDSVHYSKDIGRNTGYCPLGENNSDKNAVHEEAAYQFMLDAGAPLTDAITCMGSAVDGEYSVNVEPSTQRAAEAASKFTDELAECDPKKMNVRGRIIYVHALSANVERFRKQLAILAEDGSKIVRTEVINVFKAHKELAPEVKELLASKKQAKRDTALSILEEWGNEGFADELNKALDSEKNDKLKMRIAALIGSENAAAAVQTNSKEIIKKLLRGASKLAWLYSTPFQPVHKTDGTEADEDDLKAIMLCYASMEKPGRNQFACELAEVLDAEEFAVFAREVFARWYDKGAEAKTKWVLYFSAVHGGTAMCRDLVGHIKTWGEYSFNMRTAIAGEAVKALAMNGSSEALMTVDQIARKFKSKSVRAAAVNAMAAAADGLGITAEELADRIVPDLGFDGNLCRVFDYGKRQFHVYIRPSLELEIFNGDKKIKTMPKPGTTDDAEKANAAYEQFKDMKKLMKTAVAAQKQRLEYVLMCDRKWSVEGWNTLFVKNAIMHCFAIGLIWGIYDNGKLTATFRYMEDGSFTTSDGDEFEIPENAVIGLVHPIELSDELKAEWTEQLGDYEIVQPFPQLERRIFTRDDKELELKRIPRFKGSEISSLSLTGKMTKHGWYKGQAEDAGCFYYFIREDVSSRSVAPDGSPLLTGYGTMLIHSGMCIAVYDTEDETVHIEDLVFFKAGTKPEYWNDEDNSFIKCSEIPARYFSEIILQLTSVLGSREEN